MMYNHVCLAQEKAYPYHILKVLPIALVYLRKIRTNTHGARFYLILLIFLVFCFLLLRHRTACFLSFSRASAVANMGCKISNSSGRNIPQSIPCDDCSCVVVGAVTMILLYWFNACANIVCSFKSRGTFANIAN